MKILIVDDEQNKIDMLHNQLLGFGVQSADISVAYHAAQARKLLGEVAFDIMLLDVLLPVRNQAKPSGETSVELLRQLVEDGVYNAPKYIIGVTADLSALALHKDEFQKLTFHIIEVAPTSDEWKSFLHKILLIFQGAKKAESAYDYDVCVLTALREPELKAVFSTWNPKINSEESLTRGVIAKSGFITCGGDSKKVAFAHLPQMGLVAATHTTEALLQSFKPHILIMTGICGGFSDYVQVGDVVIADKSWDWQAGKWTRGRVLVAAPDQKEASSELVAVAQDIEAKLSLFQREFPGNVPPEMANLKTGPMVSGSSVVASTDIQKVFRGQHRKMVAVDMECYGMYHAAAMTAAPPPKTICIKSVSDLADRTKDDNFQKYCSYMSARVALELLHNYWKS